MDALQEIFQAGEEGKLTWEQFESAVQQAGIKLADLSEGNYVSKQKYEDELAAKTKEVEQLNETISTRDTDLANLQEQLKAAGTDAEKLATLSNDFASLKGKYDEEVKTYKNQLRQQAYEFAVRQHAGELKFSSEAAKRDYINQAIAKEMKMEGDSIIGVSDFDAIYNQNNADAFIKEEPGQELPPEVGKPQFIGSTQGDEPPMDPTGGFASAFHFTPIHPMPAE